MGDKSKSKSRQDLALEVKILRRCLDHLIKEKVVDEAGRSKLLGFLAGAGVDYAPPVIMN